MKLTEEQLEVARIELERRAREKKKTIKRIPTVTRDNLSNYIYNEYSEVGEYWRAVYEINDNYSYCTSELFQDAIEKELDLIAQEINENYLEIVDVEGELIELEYIEE